MSKHPLILIVSLLVAFVSGLGLGLFMGSSSPSSSDTSNNGATPSSSSRDASLSEAQSHNTLLDAQIAELKKELDDQKKDQDTLIMADRLALFKKHIKYMNVQSLDENLKVTAAMADILKLMPEEQKAIEQHLAQAQDETQKLEDAKMTLVKQSGNSVTYEIPTYPEGKEIKDKLNSLLSADIGDDRAELFISNSGGAFKSQFSDFGEQKTQIQITQTDQAGTYRIKESYLNSDGAPTSWTESAGSTALPKRWQKLIQLPAQ